MRKIFDLSEKEFLTGISPSAQVQNKGLWATMRGVTAIRDIGVGNDELGLLQGALAAAVQVTLSDVPLAYARDITGSTDQVYFIGDAGHLYSYDISDAAATDKRSGTPISNPANAIEIFQPRGGTKYLYYWQAAQIGRWDMSGSYPTGWTDNWATGLQSTIWHPKHRLFDRIYYGNLNYIGYIGDDGAAGVTHVKDALNLPIDFRVNCLDDDGVYLIAGLSTNTSTLITNEGHTKVIFWDTNSSSWQREWDIPEAAIFAIKRVGAVHYAICAKAIYAFTFKDPPEIVLGPFSTGNDLPDYDIQTQHAATVVGDALLWASAFSSPTAGDISSFGRLSPQAPKAYLRPLAGLPTKPVLIAADIISNQLFVACRATNALYVVTIAATSASASSGSNTYAETIYLDLERWWQIGRLVIEFDVPLGSVSSSDQIRASLRANQDSTYTVYGSVTAGSIRFKEFYNTLEARKLQIKMEFLGGAPKIRRIQVFGDPIEHPTH